MSLYQKEYEHRAIDPTFGSAAMSSLLPKDAFPEAEMNPQDAYQAIHNELVLDGNASQNLATFCQTWLDDETHKLMDECIDKNMIDKDEYPQTAELEARCVRMLGNLWNSPEEANTIGTSTTGSSEAAMLGGLAALWRWRKKRKAQGKPTDKPNIVTGAVIERTFNPTDKMAKAHIETKEMQYLYNDGDLYYFMDLDTYDQLPLTKDQVEDAIPFVKENTNVTVRFFKGAPFSVEAPNFVELEVTATEPGFKGDTASNTTKPATVETGFTLQVPLFIEIGDKLKIDTRNGGEYLGRA